MAAHAQSLVALQRVIITTGTTGENPDPAFVTTDLPDL
jgi:hypothetical protein